MLYSNNETTCFGQKWPSSGFYTDFWPKHVVSLLEYNLFITKLCCLTTLTPLISYTHNGDDTH